MASLQVNVKLLSPPVAYARYDWLRGERFDDAGLGRVTGPLQLREWAGVVRLQWYALEHLKLIGEYSRHQFTNPVSSPQEQKVRDEFVSLRAVLAF